MDPIFKTTEKSPLSKLTPSLSNKVGSSSADSLLSAIDDYLNDIATSCTAQTLAEKRAPLNWFAELVGTNSSVADITEKHVLSFKTSVRKLRKKAQSDLPLKDCLTDDPARQVHPKTARKKYHTIMTFLRWLRDLGKIPSVPGDQLKFPIKQTSKNRSVRPFTVEELNRLFSSPLFTGCESKTIRHKPGNLIMMDDQYWILLILAHTGMRLREVLQLAAINIEKDKALPFIRLDGSRMSLKSLSSERLVPIHPNLIKFGFLDFVDLRAKEQPDAVLFDQSVSKGNIGNFYSQKFGRFFNRIKLDDPLLKTHSLRHTFIDALRNAEVPDSGLKQIIGHRDHSVTNQYGTGASIAVLNKYVSSVDLGLSTQLIHRLMENASDSEALKG